MEEMVYVWEKHVTRTAKRPRVGDLDEDEDGEGYQEIAPRNGGGPEGDGDPA